MNNTLHCEYNVIELCFNCLDVIGYDCIVCIVVFLDFFELITRNLYGILPQL